MSAPKDIMCSCGHSLSGHVYFTEAEGSYGCDIITCTCKRFYDARINECEDLALEVAKVRRKNTALLVYAQAEEGFWRSEWMSDLLGGPDLELIEQALRDQIDTMRLMALEINNDQPGQDISVHAGNRNVLLWRKSGDDVGQLGPEGDPELVQ